jgi:hypothetical protein
VQAPPPAKEKELAMLTLHPVAPGINPGGPVTPVPLSPPAVVAGQFTPLTPPDVIAVPLPAADDPTLTRSNLDREAAALLVKMIAAFHHAKAFLPWVKKLEADGDEDPTWMGYGHDDLFGCPWLICGQIALFSSELPVALVQKARREALRKAFRFNWADADDRCDLAMCDMLVTLGYLEEDAKAFAARYEGSRAARHGRGWAFVQACKGLAWALAMVTGSLTAAVGQTDWTEACDRYEARMGLEGGAE